MAAGRKILIEFIGSDKSAGRTASDLEKKFGKLGARMNKVGQVSGRILAGGLVLAAGAALKAGQAAADDEMAQVKLANALRQGANATDKQIASVEEWIAAQGKALGVTDDELRPAYARLAAATGDVESAQRQLSLAMDIAAGTGQSLETVTKAMQKGINGSVGGLGRLGAATKNAAGETMSYEEVLASLASKHLNAADKAAETTAGKQKILQVQFAELQEEIGVKLIPALTKLATVGLKVVDWIGKNQTTVAILVGGLGALLAITWATTTAIAAWAAITKLATAAQIVATNAQWAFNVAMSANPIALVVIAVAALVAGLIIAYKKSETFRNIVNAAFGAVANAAKAAVEFIKRHWKTLLAILTGPVGIAVALIIKHRDKIQAAFFAAVGWIKGKWSALKEALSNPIDRAKELIRNQISTIKDVLSSLKDRASDVGGRIRDFLESAFKPIQTAISWVQSLIEKINALINRIKDIRMPNIDIPGLRTSVAVTTTGGPTLPGKSIPSSGGVSARGGAIGRTGTLIVQMVTPTGQVLEQTLIQYNQATGRPLQVQTI